MNITVIVNEAPWAGGLATTALRLVRAAVDDGIGVAAVYFRGEGVYHSISGGAADAGAPDLSAEWLALSRSCGFPLLLCSSDTQRRLPGDPGKGFRIAGLPEVLHIAADSDRVVTF